MLELAGRGAIIAGTRRVGAVVARRLHREGVRLAILYRSSKAAADALAAELEGSYVIQTELTDEAQVEAAVAAARERLGDLSFCINLASDYPRVPFEKLNGASWDAGLAAAKGTYLLALHAARAMASNRGPTRGHLVFAGDWAAEETPYTDFLPYLTAKAAIHFMTRAFAVELASQGILVNTVLPGPTRRDTPVSADEWREVMIDTPLHRESEEDEIAEVIATMLRLETMTGEIIRVDAGRHISGNRPK